MTDRGITKKRRAALLALLEQSPHTGGELAKALGVNSATVSFIVHYLMAEKAICRERVGTQQWRYYLGAELPPPAPVAKRAYRVPVTSRIVPRYPGTPNGQTMRLTLPAAPWEVRT